MTIAVREESGSFCCSVEEAVDGDADAAEDVILPRPFEFASAGKRVLRPRFLFKRYAHADVKSTHADIKSIT
jgi:hypothetical protein